MQRMGALVLLGIGGLAFVGVPMNALFFQDGRHPAPLFTTHVIAPQKSEPAATAAAPRAPARVESAAIEPDAVKPEPLKIEAAPPVVPKAIARRDAAALKDLMKPEPAPAQKLEKAKPETKKKLETASRDAIGALLGAGPAAKPAPARPAKPSTAAARPATAAAPAPAAAGPEILSAQRTLQRLGYVVKPDGAMNSSTRQAIEKFERENGLPAKGDVTPKILKLLSARAAQ